MFNFLNQQAMDKYSVKSEKTAVMELEIPFGCFSGCPDELRKATLARINSLLKDYKSEVTLSMSQFRMLDQVYALSSGLSTLKFRKMKEGMLMTLYKRSYVIAEDKEPAIAMEGDLKTFTVEQVAAIANAMSLLYQFGALPTENTEYFKHIHKTDMENAGVDGRIIDHFLMLC